jgi:ketosteroid isomerase-like protein
MSAISLTMRDGREAACSMDTLSDFRGRMKGSVLVAGDPHYDEARQIWNGAHDKHPAIIARCSGVADVIEAVNFGRQTGALVAVRGGGHNVAGTSMCDGGLIIDLSTMKGIRADPAARRVWAQAGATWGDLDRETQAFAMVTPGGNISSTGIAGLTLGGGMGWFRRMFGMSADNVVSVWPEMTEVVGKPNMADGLISYMKDNDVVGKLTVKHIWVSGDHATRQAEWEEVVTPKNGGRPEHHSGRCTLEWQKIDGKWQVISEYINYLDPPSEVQS